VTEIMGAIGVKMILPGEPKEVMTSPGELKEVMTGEDIIAKKSSKYIEDALAAVHPDDPLRIQRIFEGINNTGGPLNHETLSNNVNFVEKVERRVRLNSLLQVIVDNLSAYNSITQPSTNTQDLRHNLNRLKQGRQYQFWGQVQTLQEEYRWYNTVRPQLQQLQSYKDGEAAKSNKQLRENIRGVVAEEYGKEWVEQAEAVDRVWFCITFVSEQGVNLLILVCRRLLRGIGQLPTGSPHI
jgi:hypothetical protein